MNSLLIIIDAPFVFHGGILLPYFKIKNINAMITKIPFCSGSDFLPEVSCHYIDVFKYSVTVSLLSVFGYFI